MLVNRHDCLSILYKMHESGVDITPELKQVLDEDVTPKKVIDELIRQNNNVVNFYLNLNKKAHKIIKETLTCEGKPVATYLKIATSFITQGIIAMEHLYVNDIEGQNNFIECLGLDKLSAAISSYFATGDYAELVKAVNNNKKDIKELLDSRK